MLAEAPGVVYIHEPFSVTDPPSPGICNAQISILVYVYYFCTTSLPSIGT